MNNDRVVEEGVILILDPKGNPMAMARNDVTGQHRAVIFYKLEKMGYGDLKEFMKEVTEAIPPAAPETQTTETP